MELKKMKRGRKGVPAPSLTICKGGIVVFNVTLSSLLDTEKGIVWSEKDGLLTFENRDGDNSYAINVHRRNAVSRTPLRPESSVSVKVEKKDNVYITDYRIDGNK